MTPERVRRRLDEATAGRRLLDHPFYAAWAAGELTTEDLSYYATQYWRQVEAFPGYLEALAQRTEEPAVRKTLETNLSDERGDDHAGLWLRFAEGVGAEESHVQESAVEDETAHCVSTFDIGSQSAPVPFALGMLYGYESQTPAVARTKVEGLRSHYGIDGDAVSYFELHADVDERHSDELADAVALACNDESELREAEAGAMTGAAAVWHLLDGVARVRDIA